MAKWQKFKPPAHWITLVDRIKRSFMVKLKASGLEYDRERRIDSLIYEIHHYQLFLNLNLSVIQNLTNWGISIPQVFRDSQLFLALWNTLPMVYGSVALFLLTKSKVMIDFNCKFYLIHFLCPFCGPKKIVVDFHHHLTETMKSQFVVNFQFCPSYRRAAHLPEALFPFLSVSRMVLDPLSFDDRALLRRARDAPPRGFHRNRRIEIRMIATCHPQLARYRDSQRFIFASL